MDIKVLTIGHSNHPLDHFIALLRMHGATAVADVRSAPYSRSNPHFNREMFQHSLKTNHIAYVFLGRELGGRPEDPGCYNDGKVQYQKLAESLPFRDGLQRVLKGAHSHRIVLLCAEAEPLICHRALLVSQQLTAAGTIVGHIHANGMLESHAHAMWRLVQTLGLSDTDLYRSKDEVIADACALQAKRVAYSQTREKATA